jgi:hypothetical protein
VFQIIVGHRMDGDRLDVHFAAGPQDAQGDFASIGYDHFFQHRDCGRLFGLTLVDDE